MLATATYLPAFSQRSERLQYPLRERHDIYGKRGSIIILSESLRAIVNKDETNLRGLMSRFAFDASPFVLGKGRRFE
ncbi:hypothetical protein [Pseudovibrio sp. JE062]|uniref:hypothetical protein n=1 Tax=Pseudovibrio sp. JE062 TaxID=439495 RepID=UPI000186BB96|nr:hypothetical protein [Pseudovibrio sp. JE062]EEA94735.1 hypothetical protein PJE062_723 [Pseudovibrio sp. JE062]